jgi:cobalt-zinc-cadmium efflux system membrane fusion protein
MKGKFLLIIILVAITAVVTFTLTKSSVSKPDGASEEHAEEPAAGKPEIEGLKFEPAIAGESWDVVTATGKVGPNTNEVVKVGPRVPGKITSVRVNVGDTVTRGQVLAMISSVELGQARAAYHQASAKLSAAEQAYDSQVQLSKLGAFTKRPVEEARGEHTEAQGELAQARSELAQNQSELIHAQSELAQCTARLERAKDLYKDQIISKQDLESAEAEYKKDSASVEMVKAKINQTQAKIEQLKARVELAGSYLEREQKVAGANLLSTRELQAVKAAVTEAKLELQAAADTIKVLGASPSGSGDTITISSPISGRVVDRDLTLGEMVEPSKVLFTVMNLSDVWVEASVYEKDLQKIHKGQTAEIRINGYSDRVFSGKVTHISDVLDGSSRTAKVRCVVSNSDGTLKPEMFASVDIITARRGGAVLIPKKAVLDEGSAKIVFMVCTECPEDIEAGKSVCGEYDKRTLELGPTHGDKVEVISGLAPGDEVVIEGQFQLKTAISSGKLEAGCTDH